MSLIIVLGPDEDPLVLLPLKTQRKPRCPMLRDSSVILAFLAVPTLPAQSSRMHEGRRSNALANCSVGKKVGELSLESEAGQ